MQYTISLHAGTSEGISPYAFEISCEVIWLDHDEFDLLADDKNMQPLVIDWLEWINDRPQELKRVKADLDLLVENEREAIGWR